MRTNKPSNKDKYKNFGILLLCFIKYFKFMRKSNYFRGKNIF